MIFGQILEKTWQANYPISFHLELAESSVVGFFSKISSPVNGQMTLIIGNFCRSLNKQFWSFNTWSLLFSLKFGNIRLPFFCGCANYSICGKHLNLSCAQCWWLKFTVPSLLMAIEYSFYCFYFWNSLQLFGTNF